MFLDELEQRSGRLAAAAAALASGEPSAVDLPSIRREGHTIKGTARVMGYEAVAAAAVVIEAAWDGIATESVDPSIELGTSLGALTQALLDAGRTDPVGGTPELRATLEALAGAAPAIEMPDLEFLPEPSAATPASSTASLRSLGPLGRGDTRRPPDRSAQMPAFPRSPGHPGSSTSQPAGSELSIPGEYLSLIESIEEWADDATVIVSSARLYGLINRAAAVREDATALAHVINGGSSPSDEARERIAEMVSSTADLQADALGLASVPLSTLTTTLPQLVGYLSKKLGKNIEFNVSGDVSLVVDRQVLEAVSEPVRQLIVNAMYHGLELPAKRKAERKPSIGSLTLDVSLDGTMLELVVADDGAGVDWAKVREAGIEQRLLDKNAELDTDVLTPLLYEPGFTTGAIEGGRGDGLARLAEAVEELHGRVHLETWQDAGTRVSIRVPAWQPLHRVLIVRAGGMRWAIPEAAIEHALPTEDLDVDLDADISEIDWDGRLIPVASFAEAVGVEDSGPDDITVIVGHRVGTVALTVGRIEGEREVAVTEAGGVALGPSHIAAVAPLGDGVFALVVDVGRLIERVRAVPAEDRAPARLLVLDDTETRRGALSGALSAGGFNTSLANSVAEAMDILDADAMDAVIVEYAVPSASGIAFVEETRRRYPKMPIVMVSGTANEDDRVRAKKAGVDRFFAKSEVREGVVVSAVWDLLEA